MNILYKIKNKMSYTQFIALGFVLIILIGALLLLLPFSTKNGEQTDVLSALFTSVSATCVTGLVVYDTYTHWTWFGKLVIICLIQIGGLGFVTIGTMFAMALKRKVSLRNQGLLTESISAVEIGGVMRLIKKVVFGTFLFEFLGGVLLSIRFAFDMPLKTALIYGFFHSISAFCNAGFDLFGRYEAYSSLCTYVTDFSVNIIISILIIVGGLGFIVWDDISIHKLRVKKYSLHSKIVLWMTAFLLIVPTILFFLFESDKCFANMSGPEKYLAAFFSGVTARTAGFNTVDTGALSNASKFLTITLMFIGGSPGSTAGGVKTTTMFVFIFYLWSNIQNQYGIDVFHRRLEDDSIKKAALVLSVNSSLAIVGIICIMGFMPELGFSDVIFEVVSAIDTVGMTTGITRDLNSYSRVVIMILMFLGRVGSLSFAMSFKDRRKIAPVLQPSEHINIG